MDIAATALALGAIERRLQRDDEHLREQLARFPEQDDVRARLMAQLTYVTELQAIILYARGGTVCNWCTDPRHPSPEHHDRLNPILHAPRRETRQ